MPRCGGTRGPSSGGARRARRPSGGGRSSRAARTSSAAGSFSTRWVRWRLAPVTVDDRRGETRVGVEPVDAVGLVASAAAPARGARRRARPTARRPPPARGVSTPPVWSIAVRSSLAPRGTPVAWPRAPAACRAVPAQHRRGRPRRQRAADHRRRWSRPRPPARPGGLPRAGHHRLPARGPGAEARLRRRQPSRPRRRSRPAPVGARRSSASSTPSATCTTPRPCAHGGEVLGVYRKRLLPNYAVFDEQRYFTPGSDAARALRGRRRPRRRERLRGRVEPARARSPSRPPAGPSSS